VNAQLHSDRWIKLEQAFAADSYNGLPDAPALMICEPTDENDGLVVAAHAVNHLRNGTPKPADRGTGGLAQLLAEETGCGFLIVSRFAPADANFDPEHPVKSWLEENRPTFVLDIHGMLEDSSDADIEIGLGRGLVMDRFVSSLLSATDMKVALGKKFDASRTSTITRFSQSLGLSSTQIEISSSFRPPLGKQKSLCRLVSHMISAIRTHQKSVRI